MTKKKEEDTYVGQCYVCETGIHKRGLTSDGQKGEDEHYIIVGAGVVRCVDCAPGTQIWLDSPVGQNSKYREYFERGMALRQESRKIASVQRAARVDTPSPLLKSFAGRIKYFMHMWKLQGLDIAWQLELTNNEYYYEASFTEDGTLTIEANGVIIPFEPKDTLTQRLKAVTP